MGLKYLEYISELIPLRSDGSQDKQMGRLSCMSAGQSQLKGGPSGWSPLRSDGSHVGQVGRLDCHEVVANDTQV